MLGFNEENNSQVIPSIELPDDLFEESINPWKFSLIGRLNLQQIKLVDASIILRQQWKLTGNCKLIPLGRGFFTIKLDNEVDREYIKEGKWEVLDQILQIRKWISNFRLESQKASRAMVWVRFPGLGLEFWNEKILFKICKEIGTPIKLDEATAKCEVGYYANVLVDIDFANSIPNKIWIGTKHGGFFQSISIPACPKFCSTCKIVGHFITECRVDGFEESTTSGKTDDLPNVDSVVSNIVTLINLHSVSNSVNIVSGRFEVLNDMEHKEDDVISADKEILAEMDPQKLIQVSKVTELEKSVIHFVNAESGKVTPEPVPFTTWSKVATSSNNKKTDTEVGKSSQTTKVTSTNKAQAATKYNFRRNVGKGGTKPPQSKQ
ncbi:uncharacterized protein LOC113295241 [Papaver somniferum]|uniref:uncharacterized protein LOC113295241 n=1 Tax=Papaver somniferum TaxID=3469 RepID=UPI000E6FE73C|nr:uncharacterized protein LOC113295241 [Papaver somniferum]